jgi:SAM-dependent methyltransferase
MDEARRRADAEVSTGTTLPQLYMAAGLPSPNLRLDAPVGFGSDWVGYNYLVEMLRGMLPLMHLYGIATEEDVGIDGLANKMQTEAAALASIVILTPCIGAWTARRPAGLRTGRPRPLKSHRPGPLNAAQFLLQAELYEPITRRFLIEAGLRAGMRVLDVGSGTGSVSIILADLVGPSGSVVGIEHSASMLEIAIQRSRSADKTNVTFVQGNVESTDSLGRFDAIVGRFVLRELKDAAQALRKLSKLLVPRGIIAFQEKVRAIPVTSFPRLSVVNKICSWMDEARRRADAEVSTGTTLPQLYMDCEATCRPPYRPATPLEVPPSWTS